MNRAANIHPEIGGSDYRPEAFEPMAKPAKPTRAFCKQHARELLGKPYAPADPVTQGVVINALCEYAESEAHVQRIVAEILANVESWPDVTDIRRIALETRTMESRPNPGCQKCDGSGFRRPIVRGGYEYNGGRCDCWRYVRVPA